MGKASREGGSKREREESGKGKTQTNATVSGADVSSLLAALAESGRLERRG